MNESTQHITAAAIRRISAERLAANSFDDSVLLDDIADKLEEYCDTIAEQAAALEGYRTWLKESGFDPDTLLAYLDQADASVRLPAAEIAELRKRGVEVGD